MAPRAFRRRLTLAFLGLAIAGLLVTVMLPDGRAGAAQNSSSNVGRLVTRIVDERTGRPLIATVVVRGVQRLAGLTDAHGYFKATVPAGTYWVSALCTACSTPTRRVTVAAGRTSEVKLALSVAAASASAGTQRDASPSPGPGTSQTGVSGSLSETGGGDTTPTNTRGSTSGPTPAPGALAGTGTSPGSGTAVGSSGPGSGSASGNSSSSSAAPSSGAPPSGGSAGSGSPSAGSGAPPTNGGGSGSGLPNSGSAPPTSDKVHRITSLVADPVVTEPGETSRISVEVDNPSGNSLKYTWQASGGNISGTGAQIAWEAPATEGDFTISATVTDSKNRSASASVVISVVASPSSPPSPPPAPPIPTPPAPPSGGRDPAAWPFSATSPWNHPIGSGAVYSRINSPTWNVAGGGHANIEWYSIPTYVATGTDPLRRIIDRRNGRLVDTIRVPPAARPAQGTDGHLNIIDETHRWVSELYAVEFLPNGDLSTIGYNKNDLRGPGGGFDGWHGSVAAGTSGLGGMVRKGELTQGTANLRSGVRHALQGVVRGIALNRNAPGGRAFVWPASSADTSALQGRGYSTSGNVYMGSLLAIPPWVNLDQLGITDPQAMEVARALQDYGVYIVDTGGVALDKIVIRIDPQAADDIRNRGAFSSGLSRALRQLWVVSNSHANGYAPSVPGGGGTPRRDLPPGFASGTRLPLHQAAGGTAEPLVFSMLAVAIWLPLVHRRRGGS